MTVLLYVDHGLGAACGVHDFGRRHVAALRRSDRLTVVHVEASSAAEYAAHYDEANPDVVLFNYMPLVMPWVGDPAVTSRPAPRVVVQHLYSDRHPGLILDGYGTLFQAMFLLDPGLLVAHPRVFSMPRPLPTARPTPSATAVRDAGPVRVGSFGFALPHKHFPLIAREVNRCFDEAVFSLHMTVGRFTGDYTTVLAEQVLAELTKPGVTLELTTDYLSEADTVDLLGSNHVNALFYELEQEAPGLSSATDYLVAAGRPMLLTRCDLFRHVLPHTNVYPDRSLSDVLNDPGSVLRAQALRKQLEASLPEATERALEKLL